MPTSSPDSFLSELWVRRANEEATGRQETPEERAVALYLELKHAAAGNSRLEGLLRDVEAAALGYAGAIVALTQRRIEGADTNAIANADERRAMGHNRLIDALNILSRQWSEAGLDNSWRADIGLHREAVGAWGRAVAEFLRREGLKEEKPWAKTFANS